MGIMGFLKKISGSKRRFIDVDNYYIEEKHITEDKEKYTIKYDPSMEEITIEKESNTRTECIKINHDVFIQLWTEYLNNILDKEVGIHTQTGTESWGENYTLFIGKTNEGDIKIQYTLHFGEDDHTESITISSLETKAVMEILKKVYEKAVEYVG